MGAPHPFDPVKSGILCVWSKKFIGDSLKLVPTDRNFFSE